MRSDNITRDIEFIYAPDGVSFGDLIEIHEWNKLETDAVNKNLQQIRNGTKW